MYECMYSLADITGKEYACVRVIVFVPASVCICVPIKDVGVLKEHRHAPMYACSYS